MFYRGPRAEIVFATATGFSAGSQRVVNRENLYNDVLTMYQEGSVALEYPLSIKYEGENAVDDGGVQRDMFSAFWTDAYTRLFEGAKTLIPMVQPGVDIATFSTLGKKTKTYVFDIIRTSETYVRSVYVRPKRTFGSQTYVRSVSYVSNVRSA